MSAYGFQCRSGYAKRAEVAERSTRDDTTAAGPVPYIPGSR
jgi:hypothetical protein